MGTAKYYRVQSQLTIAPSQSYHESALWYFCISLGIWRLAYGSLADAGLRHHCAAGKVRVCQQEQDLGKMKGGQKKGGWWVGLWSRECG